jgi:L-fucono-1,5-lactonase
VLVDTHQHFWNPDRIPQPWMTAEHAAIDRIFEPPDLEPLLAECGVRQTVLVQSAASDEDTDYMFEVAEGVAWVGAIVGWCRLDDPAAASRRLDELQAHPKLRGVRHLIHQEPDPHWIRGPAVADGLALLEERQLLLELPAVYPNHLDDVPTIAGRHPGLTIVIDHLGKPPLGTEDMGALGGAAACSGGAAECACEGLGPEHGDGKPTLGGGRPPARGRRRARRFRSRAARLRERLARRAPERHL